MKVEEINPVIGNFGRYQVFMLSYAGVYSVIGCMVTLGNVFYAAETDHWCKLLPEENCSSWLEFQDNCTDVKKSILLPPPENEDSKYPYSNCMQWDLPAGYVFDPHVPLGDMRNFTYREVPCTDGWEYDTSQYNTTTISEFDLVCDESSLPSLAQSLYFVGFLVASFAVGTLSDWLGRKRALSIALCLYVTGSVVTSFSVNAYMYMAFRFLTGFGEFGSYLAIYVLVVEVVGKSWRTAVTMALSIFFAVGYFFLATAAMYVREWRPLCLIVSLMSVLMLIPLVFVQESISWLISKGRLDEAEAVVRKVARYNKRTVPDGLFEREGQQEQTEPIKESTIPPSVIDLYRTPNMAVKTLNMQYNWFVNSLVYYGLSLSTGDLGVDAYWAFFVSGAVEIPALIYATFGVEWFGRKWNTAILELIGGVACLATIFIPMGIWRTVVAMIGKFCISATFAIIYLLSGELFPTPVRAIGIGMCSVASRVGAIISPIILLLGVSAASLPSILFGSSAVLAGILVLLLPETKGRNLPQTLEEGEAMGKWRCLAGGDAHVDSDIEHERIQLNSGSVSAVSKTSFE